MKKIENISFEKYFIWAFVFIVIFVFIYSYQTNQWNFTLNYDERNKCRIEFGEPKCENGKLIIPFYNPSNFSMNVVIKAKTNEGVDIINVSEPLESNKTETLELPICYPTEAMEVEWCCNVNCSTISMSQYTKDLVVNK